MRTHQLRTFLVTCALYCGLVSTAQTYLLQEGFEGAFPPSGWTVNTPSNELADGWTHGPASGLLSGICVPQGSRAMVSQWATFYPNNTWAFTPGMALVAGTPYTLSFKQCVQSPSSNKTESLKITVGTQANIASQTVTLLDLPALTNTSPATHSTTFTPAVSGLYHFAFNCYSAANQRYLSVDSVNIYTAATPAVFPAPYCAVAFPLGVEPITRVEFAGIASTSSTSLSSPAHEDFTDRTGNVLVGGTYPITIKGNTNGATQSFVKVFIDWNQDHEFADPAEAYVIGALSNSTGIDAVFVTAVITVPANATMGNTRMRVIKKRGSHASTPCAAEGNGQSEDYSLNVAGVTSVEVRTVNNATAYITTNGGTLPLTATVYPSTVSQAVTWSIIPGSGGAIINAAGVVTAQGNGNVWAKATSVVDPSKKDSLQITIINQFVAPTAIVISTVGNVPPTINASSPDLALRATISPANASQAVIWEVRPVTGNVSINSAGVVTPISNGTAWAKAKAATTPSLKDSLLLTINVPGIGFDETEAVGLLVVPNPTTGMVFIHGAGSFGAGTLQLLDVTGRLVMQQRVGAEMKQEVYTVDLSTLRNGVYVLQLHGAGYRHAQRIMKE